MSQHNKHMTRIYYAAGASIGRIAKALNVTVRAVAHELSRGGL